MIWVGTDDGNIAVTKDGGTHWNQVATNITDVPAGRWVSWVEASRFDPANGVRGRSIVTRMAIWAPTSIARRILEETWAPLVSPQTVGVRGFAHVIKEDSRDPDLLFLGTEFGLWMSIDAGKTWAAFKPETFPNVPVRDMVVQDRDNDLVIATHGRGIWIVDDLTPLRNLTSATTDEDVALLPGRVVQQRIEANGGWAEGDASYAGANPADGAVISYYLKTRQVIGKLTLDILDASGKIVATIEPGKTQGAQSRRLVDAYEGSGRAVCGTDCGFVDTRRTRVAGFVYRSHHACGVKRSRCR